MPLLPLRDYLYLGAILALLVGAGWYTHHERALGRQQIEQADASAKAILDAQVKADEQIAQKKADEAAGERNVLQAQIDAAIAHRTTAVRLCIPDHSDTGLPGTAKAGESATPPSTGPFAVREVPGRDISGDLDALVRAAATVDGLYRARQEIDARMAQP